MGAGHAHTLHHHGHSRVHRLPPEVKVAATLAFVASVAVTPREAVWAFGVDALVLAAVIRVAGLPPRFVAARLTVIAPFVAFALLLPFVAGGERIRPLGVSVSHEGAWATFNILAKATLGAGSSIVLAGTTETSRILQGLERLRVPPVFTAIAAFMLRYLELFAAELHRMRTAMTSRGYAPRWWWQARPLATAAGALFIRSYERGERVHAAMVSRGFTGQMPDLHPDRATVADRWVAAVPPAVASITAVVAMVVT